jgi:chemotaxis protein methyltransferase CheR
MIRVGTKSVTEYINFAKNSLEEQENLKQAFSINVTHFFRNADTYEVILKKILPTITANNARAKIWSAGCADGAEPYSLAMMLHSIGIQPGQAKILASDYNPESLEMAKRGIYPKEYDRELPIQFKKYLTYNQADNTYQIDTNLKNYIDFKIHNLISDDLRNIGENSFNLILCRNVLIYFTKEQQELIYEKFYAGLKKDGFFIVGRSEIILGNYREKFSLFDSNHRISQKIV